MNGSAAAPLMSRAFSQVGTGIIFIVKTSLAAFGRGKKKSMGWRHNDAIARASTRIEFQEALIRFFKLDFSVAHGEFLSLQYEDYI